MLRGIKARRTPASRTRCPDDLAQWGVVFSYDVLVSTAFILFAHGSSVESANEAVRAVAREVARQGELPIIETAFLESSQPDLSMAVQRLVQQGFRRIVIIPYFLTLGIHLRRDLPAIVQRLTQLYHGLTLSVTEPLDGHPALTQIVLDRAKKAIEC